MKLITPQKILNVLENESGEVKVTQEVIDKALKPLDRMLELDEPLLEALILDFPTKNLCSEDCKGLCPVCGVNLNKETCDCEMPNWTPGHRNPFEDLL